MVHQNELPPTWKAHNQRTTLGFMIYIIYLSIYLSVCLSVCLSIYLYLYLSISIHFYSHLSISIYLHLSISIYIYLYLSIFKYIYIYAKLVANQRFIQRINCTNNETTIAARLTSSLLFHPNARHLASRALGQRIADTHPQVVVMAGHVWITHFHTPSIQEDMPKEIKYLFHIVLRRLIAAATNPCT